MKIEDDGLYDVAAISKILGIAEKTTRKFLREGTLKGKKLSKKWYVTGSSVKAYFADETIEPENK